MQKLRGAFTREDWQGQGEYLLYIMRVQVEDLFALAANKVERAAGPAANYAQALRPFEYLQQLRDVPGIYLHIHMCT